MGHRRNWKNHTIEFTDSMWHTNICVYKRSREWWENCTFYISKLGATWQKKSMGFFLYRSNNIGPANLCIHIMHTIHARLFMVVCVDMCIVPCMLSKQLKNIVISTHSVRNNSCWFGLWCVCFECATLSFMPSQSWRNKYWTKKKIINRASNQNIQYVCGVNELCVPNCCVQFSSWCFFFVSLLITFEWARNDAFVYFVNA